MIKKEIPLLTTVRFFAAFLILLFHLEIRWPLASLPRHLANVLNQGAIGMSLFFILSGFILTYNYDSSQSLENYKDFLIRRFARIYPIYLFAAILLLPWLGLSVHNEYSHSISSNIYHLFVTSRYLFLFIINIFILQGWFPGLFSYWNDNSSWSLSVEFFCYILFPLILCGLQHLNRQRLLLILLIAYVCTILPGLAYFLYPENVPTVSTIYAMPIFRDLPEFIVGMIFGLFFLRRAKDTKFTSIKIFIALFFLFIYLGYVGIYLPAIYVINNFAVIPIFALCIYWLAMGGGNLVKLVGNKVFILLGEASYCLYLLQVLFIYIYKDYGAFLQNYFTLLRHNSLVWLLIITFSIIFSIIIHFVIEKPLRKFIVIKYSKWKAGVPAMKSEVTVRHQISEDMST